MTTTQPSPASTATATDDPVFAERYRAIASRDRRFDGQFVTAVRTTRIYCRPSCPARTPRPENVTFYRTSAAAHEAGYRACKRCLPEAVPGTPSWDLGHDLAARAMRLVGDGVVDREGVDGLAARLGYTPRHVHRVLVAELGAGPVALARALRAQTARALLTGTDLRLADVAFAAGFGSVRQFNDTVAEVFDTTPGELRRRARAAVRSAVRTDTAPPAVGDAPPAEGADARAATLDLVLPLREPYDARGVFGFLAARAVTGVEVVDTSDPTCLSYARTLALPHGPGAFRATYGPLPDDSASRRPAGNGSNASNTSSTSHAFTSPGPPRFRVELELTSVADLPAAIARVRRLFDLDADPHAVDAALTADPALAGSVRSTPGVRLPGAVDGAEILVRALVGQQISVAAARTHLSRLAEALGAPFASRFGPMRLFPTAERLAADGAAHLRGPARRTAAILGAARALADGDLAVSPADDPAALRAALEALPGVGPWTSGYVAMRVLHDPDVLLDGDLALRAGARALGLPDDRRALVAHAERWAPWRSYAAMHLWRATGPTVPTTPAIPTTSNDPAIPQEDT
ncbi:DNA-3-methyladenine glycosylase 2 family protein [Cellulosimicrobium cellulans]|uniref:DNA-3-methyladenine glycosylase 2 family protein n=1 Tax=Cellulosimicrobium cellulans TaxID=1710 RepID=UPI0008485401|nr:AlkA N-terminal domain-containing protein [Cellulosimicrobium cellulans]